MVPYDKQRDELGDVSTLAASLAGLGFLFRTLEGFWS